MSISIAIPLWILVALSICIFFRECAAPEGVKFKNINLSKISFWEQIDKINEEEEEFKAALISEDKENLKEEFWDCMQAKLGALEKLDIKAKEVMESYQKHLVKIQNRPRGNK